MRVASLWSERFPSTSEPWRQRRRRASLARPSRVILRDDFGVVIRKDAGREAARYRVPVILQTVWARLRRDVADALLIVLVWALYVELVATSTSFEPAVMFSLAWLFALPLLLRRRWPLAAVLVSLAALSLASGLDGTGFQNLTLPFLCALAVAVAAGAIQDRAQMIAAGAGIMATIAVIVFTAPNAGAGDFFLITFFFAAAWLAGRALATRAQQTRELRARVKAAERARADAEARASAAERARIARELHDVVAHSVSVMVVQSSAVRRLLRDDQTREREALQSVEQIGRQALSEMRRMLGVMRTGEEQPAATLTPQPGLEHLDRLIKQVEEAGLPVQLRIEGDRIPLSPGVDVSAYRIVQEGLTNALKHAKGSHADVLVRYADDAVELAIEDDGPGAANGATMGHGLVGMRERVALYGGTLEAGPRPGGGGYVLRAKLPVEGGGA
jgi:signal transduction histidine kinase